MRQSTFVALVLLSGAAQSLAGQVSPSAPTGSRIINGFLDVPWGSRAPDITKTFKTPMMDRVGEDSSHVMIYKDDVLGKSVLALFYVDGKKGLLKGVYSVPYDSTATDCDVVFDKFTSFVQRLYPTIRPTEQKSQTLKGIPFCAAVDSGKATRSAVWTDLLGNSARLTLEPEVGHVDVTFQSREFKTPVVADSAKGQRKSS